MNNTTHGENVGKKLIKRIGNSIGIIFDTDDKNVYGIAAGDIVDIRDMVVIKRRGRK